MWTSIHSSGAEPDGHRDTAVGGGSSRVGDRVMGRYALSTSGAPLAAACHVSICCAGRLGCDCTVIAAHDKLWNQCMQIHASVSLI